ncbi:hypothetical protein [Streptomyces fagopyri]
MTERVRPCGSVAAIEQPDSPKTPHIAPLLADPAPEALPRAALPAG